MQKRKKYNDVLISLRKQAGLSQQEVAQRTGLSRSAISMYEAGKREPNLETFNVFADFYGVDMNCLLGKTIILDPKRVQELCQADQENRLVILTEPRKPLIWGDDEHSTILCPDCGTDLMGGFYDESGSEREMFQCPNCGCPINTKAVCTKEELDAERGNAPNKRRIFVDIDGTMARWRTTASYEELLTPGFYAMMDPNWNLVDALRILMAKHSDEIELFSLSAYLSEALLAIAEKENWLNRIVPFIPADQRLFCLCGTDKKDAVPDGIRVTDLLLDDYTVNLNDWAERGHAVKVLNGINDTSGSWTGERISIETEPELLAEQIYLLAMDR